MSTFEVTDTSAYRRQTRPEKPARDTAWATADEIEYISHIGDTLWEKKLPRMRWMHRSMLIGLYIEAAEHRSEWGDIDADEVIKYARKLKANLEQAEKENGGGKSWHQ